VLNGLSQAGPDSGAAALVPADALAFVNVSTDAGRPEVKQALALAKAFPAYAGVRAALLGRLSAIVSGSTRPDVTGGLPGWSGGEAAIVSAQRSMPPTDSHLRWPRAPRTAAPRRGSRPTGCSTPMRRSPESIGSSRPGAGRSERSAGS
jgi:hypothetical protein